MGDHSEPQQLLQLQINIVSARDIASVSKSMQTYAVVYINPDQKMTSRVDPKGKNCPEWYEKFTFWVVPQILYSDSCTVVVEIYARSCIRDTLVGSVRVPAHQIIPAHPTAQTRRAVALQIRRPSGRPQGILNIAVSLLEDSLTNIPLSGVGTEDDKSRAKAEAGSTIRRVKSDRSSLVVAPEEDRSDPTQGAGQQCGSLCNSDVGPSASVVAAAVASGLYVPPSVAKGRRKVTKGVKDDGESSILQWADEESEEATKEKIERWKTDLRMMNGGHGEGARRHHRRRRTETQGKARVFRCFGNAYGFEFTIVCGGNQANNNNNKNKNKKVHNKKLDSALSDDSSYIDL